MNPTVEELQAIQQRLEQVRQEHRDLDDAIERMGEGPYINELQLKRMKRRKLLLKDLISKLENMLIPDLNA